MNRRKQAPRHRIADLFSAWREGDAAAGDRLFGALYDELSPMAHRQLRHVQGGTLDTGAVVHETYLKLAAGRTSSVRDRAHFLALASRVMRQVVLDYARRKSALKRDGDLLRRSEQGNPSPIGTSAEDLVALDQALESLEAVDPRAARLVELRFFGGLTVQEAAEALEISPVTVRRKWLRAKAFLFHALYGGGKK